MSEYVCSKERELGIMATKIESIDKKTERIENKLDVFIHQANKTYATKLEVYEQVKSLKKQNEQQDKEIGGIQKKIWEIGLRVAELTGIILVLWKLFFS